MVVQILRNSAITLILLLSSQASSAAPSLGETYSSSFLGLSYHNILDNLHGGVVDKDDNTAISTSTMTTDQQQQQQEKICIIGSGNWGCAIATVLGRNAALLPFCSDTVNLWVFDEQVTLPSDKKSTAKLSHVINTLHENVKYLPGVKLPSNVRAIPDLKEACKNATLVRESP